MKTVQEYLRHAVECEEIASKASTPDERKVIVNMAKTWRMLASQREKLILAPSDAIAASKNVAPKK
jgi:hypothetical protein